jgi:hypothetical protein
MHRPHPRAARPSFERMETRELPSAAIYLAAAQLRAQRRIMVSTLDALAGTSTPTPSQQRRDTFVAKFTANYITGRPQLNNESQQVTIIAKRGGSNQFLHGTSLVSINLPADPTAPISRAYAAIFPQNTATTGSTLAMDLTAEPTTDLPTHLTWTLNGASGGLYSNATADTPGTLDIRYIPKKRLPGGFVSGEAILVFKGSILTTGVGNLIRTGI